VHRAGAGVAGSFAEDGIAVCEPVEALAITAAEAIVRRIHDCERVHAVRQRHLHPVLGGRGAVRAACVEGGADGIRDDPPHFVGVVVR